MLGHLQLSAVKASSSLLHIARYLTERSCWADDMHAMQPNTMFITIPLPPLWHNDMRKDKEASIPNLRCCAMVLMGAKAAALVAAYYCSRPSSSTCLILLCIMAASAGLAAVSHRPRPNATSAATVGITTWWSGFWKTNPDGVSASTLPASGVSRPPSTLNNVDLPQPFGPSSMCREPRCTCRSTDCRIRRFLPSGPKESSKLLISIENGVVGV